MPNLFEPLAAFIKSQDVTQPSISPHAGCKPSARARGISGSHHRLQPGQVGTRGEFQDTQMRMDEPPKPGG